MDMKKLLEAVTKFSGEEVGQKPGDQWKGTDKAPPGKKLVGASESVLKDLSKGVTPKTKEQELAEMWANFNEDEFGVEPKRPGRKSDRPQREYTKNGKPSKRYTPVKEGWGRGNDRVSLPDEPANYYHGTGQYTEQYNELYDKLVPSSGKADTVEGEVLRAASKIVYRHYNDGDEFNQASFDQLEQYIGTVSNYDELAEKATLFAMKAEGNYTPNTDWDSLDVMEYGPEDDDYDDEDEEEDYGWDDDDEDAPDEDDEDLDESIPSTGEHRFRSLKGFIKAAKHLGLELQDSGDEVTATKNNTVLGEYSRGEMMGWIYAPSTDSNEFKALEEDDYEDDYEDEDQGFFVALGSEDEGGFIGMVTKDGGKWRETRVSGKAPYNWGGSYMGYLTPDDVMTWIRKDYRNYDVEGPFSSEEEAREHAEIYYGLDESDKEAFKSTYKKYYDKVKQQKEQTKEGRGPSKGLHKRVKIVKGPDAGKTGYVRQIKTDRIKNRVYLDLDLEDGGQSVVLKQDVRLVKEVDEGWESGPEERAPRERDPDAEYDARRQEKLDTEAEKAQAKRPQKKYYTLSGRGPNQEPNYAFPGEYSTQDEADAARKKLMADPKTPNPRDIGISVRTRYLDEGVDTPLKDKEDYEVKRAQLQKIQLSPGTSKDPELKAEVARRMAILMKQAKDLGIEESRAHKVLSTWFKARELQDKFSKGELNIPTPQERQASSKKQKEQKKKVDEYGANNPPQGATAASAKPVDPKQAQAVQQATNTLKAATGSTVPTTNLAKAIDAASQGKSTSQQDMKALEPLMKDVATIAQTPQLAGQLKSVLSQVQQVQQKQST